MADRHVHLSCCLIGFCVLVHNADVHHATKSLSTCRTYDQLWAEGIELLRRHAEPAGGTVVISAQSLPDWQRAYAGTLQAVRKLDAAASGTVHPQREPALRAALEAAVGRLVELRTAVDAAELAAALAASVRVPAAAAGGSKKGGAVKPKARPESGIDARPADARPSLPTLDEAAEQLGFTSAEMDVPVPASMTLQGRQVCGHAAHTHNQWRTAR